MSTCLTIDLETKINQAKSNGSPYTYVDKFKLIIAVFGEALIP